MIRLLDLHEYHYSTLNLIPFGKANIKAHQLYPHTHTRAYIEVIPFGMLIIVLSKWLLIFLSSFPFRFVFASFSNGTIKASQIIVILL